MQCALEQDDAREVEVFLVCDATVSMGSALGTIRDSICEFLAVAGILRLGTRVCIYRDYDSAMPLGGYIITPKDANYEDMKKFVKANTQPIGGGGCPEAQKTAFEFLCRQELSESRANLVVHFTDAPPHPDEGSSLDREGRLERRKFEAYGWDHSDWSGLCARVRSLATVVTFCNKTCYKDMGHDMGMPYPTCEGMMEMLFTAIGLSQTDCTFGGRYTSLANILPRMDLDYIVMSMDHFHLFDIFECVLRDCPHALPTNPVLGKAWRRVCTMKRNPEIGDRVQALQAMLSAAISNSPKQTAETLKKWVAESYDNSTEIRDLISAAWVEGEPMLYMPNRITIDRKQLLDLIRECKTSQEIVRFIGTCELGTITGPSPTDGGLLQCIPLNLGPRDIFETLPSLLHQGTSFSKRGGLIFAVLSYRCQTLHALSVKHLRNNIGWVDHSFDEQTLPKIPENFSPGFMRLMCTIPPKERSYMLGESMTDTLRRFETLTCIRRNLDAVIEYTRQRDPSENWREFAVPDHKFKCVSCDIFRSVTNRAVFSPATCGLCHCIATNTNIGSFTLKDVKARHEDSEKSLMTRCTSCIRWYAVTCVDHMDTSPKCHDCRVANIVTFSNTCSSCTRAFVCPTSEGYHAKYRCQECVCQNDAVIQKETTVADLMTSNDGLWSMVGIEASVGKALRGMKMQQLLDIPISEHRTDLESVCASNTSIGASETLKVGRFPMINSSEIASRVKNILMSGDGQTICACCCELKSCNDMDMMCGNQSCSVRACTSCIREWYGQFKQGCVVYPAHFHCPYCKMKPKGCIIRRHARHMHNLHGSSQIDWSRSRREYLLWCKVCDQIATFAQRGECHDTIAPNVSDRACTQCESVSLQREEASTDKSFEEVCDHDTRSCPGECGYTIFKDGGCEHVECKCGVHICWNCMQTFDTSDDCYEHIWECTA